MARVTVEDCVQLVPNRFELVMMAAQRARDIHAGSSLTVERDNDKNPVVALREIADQTVELEVLRESLIRGHQKPPEVDEPEDEIIELMAGEAGYVGEAQPEGMVGNNMSIEGDEEDDEDDFNALLDGPQSAAGEDEEE